MFSLDVGVAKMFKCCLLCMALNMFLKQIDLSLKRSNRFTTKKYQKSVAYLFLGRLRTICQYRAVPN